MTSSDFLQLSYTSLHRFNRCQGNLSFAALQDLPRQERQPSPHISATSTPWDSGSIGLRFDAQARPSHKCLICDFYSSDQGFALSFLQIPPHGGHPCSLLTVPTAKPVVDFHHRVIAHAWRTHESRCIKSVAAAPSMSTIKQIVFININQIIILFPAHKRPILHT